MQRMKASNCFILIFLAAAAVVTVEPLHRSKRQESTNAEEGDQPVDDSLIEACNILTHPGIRYIKIYASKCGDETGLDIDPVLALGFQVSGANYMSRLLTHFEIPENVTSDFKDCIVPFLSQETKNFITYHASVSHATFTDTTTLYNAIDECQTQASPFDCINQACLDTIKSALDGIIYW